MSEPSLEDNTPLPEKTRSQVLRDLLVFQAKLFLDGLKDLMLSPVALITGIIGLTLSRKAGAPMYRTLRFGKRIERWIDLFGAAYSGEPTEVPETEQNAAKDFDTLIDRLQSSLLDPDARARLSEESKSQLDSIARKLRGSDKQ